MNTRLLIAGLIVVLGCAAVAVVMRSGPPARQASSAAPSPRRTTTPQHEAEPVIPVERSQRQRPTPAPAPAGPSAARPAARRQRAAATRAPAPTSAAPAEPAKPKKEPKAKPLEREALAYVGVDPMAEAIWLDAINDPAVSAHDRSDLIEDLNEEGFPDLKNLSREDLPMIVNRLEIIEREAPYAMDQVNADAFAEAHKDLVNMYAKVMSR